MQHASIYQSGQSFHTEQHQRDKNVRVIYVTLYVTLSQSFFGVPNLYPMSHLQKRQMYIVFITL